MKTAQDSGRNSVFAKHGIRESPRKKHGEGDNSVDEFDQLLQGSRFESGKGSSLSHQKRYYKPGAVPLITVVDDEQKAMYAEMRSGTAGTIATPQTTQHFMVARTSIGTAGTPKRTIQVNNLPPLMAEAKTNFKKQTFQLQLSNIKRGGQQVETNRKRANKSVNY